MESKKSKKLKVKQKVPVITDEQVDKKDEPIDITKVWENATLVSDTKDIHPTFSDAELNYNLTYFRENKPDDWLKAAKRNIAEHKLRLRIAELEAEKSIEVCKLQLRVAELEAEIAEMKAVKLPIPSS